MDVPKIVTDTTTQNWSRRRFMGGAVGVAALGSFAAACSATPTASVLVRAPSWPASGTSAGASTGNSAGAAVGVDVELISQRYLGLKPFAPAPPPPAVKPITLSASDPTVFSHVPLTDKVVFVTIDDGIEKDPKFIQMVKDFQVPITISLADVLIRDDYAYFAKLYETGYVSVQNHTVDHPLDMPGLSASQQLYETPPSRRSSARSTG
ncbi:MAG TPA: polysaccharide deacetylase family protein [Trebonia sp.]